MRTGTPDFRIFTVDLGTVVTLEGLTVTGVMPQLALTPQAEAVGSRTPARSR